MGLATRRHRAEARNPWFTGPTPSSGYVPMGDTMGTQAARLAAIAFLV
jgi:hypothetical protein